MRSIPVFRLGLAGEPAIIGWQYPCEKLGKSFVYFMALPEQGERDELEQFQGLL